MSNEDSGLLAITESLLFRSLDDTGRAALASQATTKLFQPGQVIVREGDPGEEMYVVKDGTVRVFTSQDGREIELAVLGRGACVGEVALLRGAPRTATVAANEACTLLQFYRKHIEQVLDKNPKVRKLLETIVAGRARDTIQKVTRPPEA